MLGDGGLEQLELRRHRLDPVFTPERVQVRIQFFILGDLDLQPYRVVLAARSTGRVVLDLHKARALDAVDVPGTIRSGHP